MTVTEPRPVATRSEEVSRSRHPRQLLLALLGELVGHGRGDGPIRAATIIDVLRGAGVAGPTARAALDRFVLRGLLSRERVGRAVEYRLTDSALGVLHEAAARVHASEPFAPNGSGWTLVTFSMPEGQRGLRHRLRATLTWEGFAPLRDGLWIAPGQLDAGKVLAETRDGLLGSGVFAFHARDVEGFPVIDALQSAWDFDEIRAEHERFIDSWRDPQHEPATVPPLTALTMLVADWLALLRRDPRLPRECFGAEWPAEESISVYRARRAELETHAVQEIRELFTTG